MFTRFILNKVKTALDFSPITYLSGPRQAGKSTLVELFSNKDREFISLDNTDALLSAHKSPREFIMARQNLCTIDEIQRCSALMLPIKESVDKSKIPGHFLLTGSANILNIPKLADSLAGRMIILKLFSLSVGEILGSQNKWLDFIFTEKIPDIFTNIIDISYEDLCSFIIKGGYPVVHQNINNEQRKAWFESYIQTMIERDLREITNFGDITRMHRLFSNISLKSATMLNVLDIGRDCQIPAASVTLYLAALESIFLLSKIPAYFTNLQKRLVKAPKFYLHDTGILCSRLNITEYSTFNERSEWGSIVETFIYGELKKQLSWNASRIEILHYRTYHGREVDFVLEAPNRDIIGIEVKTSRNISANFAKGLHHLQSEVGDKFKAGIVLYMGDETLPLGKNIWAVPMKCIL